MEIDAKALVLMKRENGVLQEELGSYEIEEGLNLVYKAYVEDGKVYLFLTTKDDVTDEEFTQIYDMYDIEKYSQMGYKVEEIDDEYNPMWCVELDFVDDHEEMQERLNDVILFHNDEMNRIYEEIR
ncbi:MULTISPECIES: DUF6762 family protein [Caloramator]|uniref:Sensory transduction regulator n=1 Tax=Caloramator proteoclasticus DSM 10124 TaxID=1121262 RepID=A0A1M5ARN3_9CLOT|nr:MULTISPECIES: DUF6762 family protein [Caloramator]SHF32899.1 hypothetical protein SAMN02746091_02275 [Caloramator proteoclasticus DSM 10124]